MEIYTIKLTDGSIQTYSTKDCRIEVGQGGIKIFETESWRETVIYSTSILYYRKEKAE